MILWQNEFLDGLKIIYVTTVSLLKLKVLFSENPEALMMNIKPNAGRPVEIWSMSNEYQTISSEKNPNQQQTFNRVSKSKANTIEKYQNDSR